MTETLGEIREESVKVEEALRKKGQHRVSVATFLLNERMEIISMIQRSEGKLKKCGENVSWNEANNCL